MTCKISFFETFHFDHIRVGLSQSLFLNFSSVHSFLWQKLRKIFKLLFEIEILKIDDEKPKNRVFKKADFKNGFIEGLKNDYENLKLLNDQWQMVEDTNDPKWNVFIELLETEYFNKEKNDKFLLESTI